MAPDIQDDNDAQFHHLDDDQNEERGRQQLVRKNKLILYNRPSNPVLDESVVSVERYNCFGTRFFPNASGDVHLVMGITSASSGDGKTVAAANLATFFALETQEPAVLVDMNFNNPQLHDVFGVSSTPGVLGALRNDTITISRTSIRGLWLLPLGEATDNSMGFAKVLEFREVISALKREFRFVVVDLPSATEASFPGMIASQLDGYIVVVSAGKTKRTDIDHLTQILNENKIIGFVMNRSSVRKARS